MNLPNKLTMLRVILVPVFMVFAAYSRYGTADFNPTFALIAGIIFAVASFTDFLDGYLARKNNLVTDFGKFMDPLADKCLTTAAFIYMVACGICSPVVLAVILFREFAAAGVHFDRDAHGHMLRGLEAAHSRARVVHAGGDATGKVFELDVSAMVRKNPRIHIIENAFLKDLIVRDGHIAGDFIVFPSIITVKSKPPDIR